MIPLSHGFTSPLRYPGGKGMLANFAKLILSQNNLLDCHYVEVYAGGASLAWELLFEEYVHHIHINDISKQLYSFWISVLNYTDDLCRLIHDTPVTVDEWHHQKIIHHNPSHHSLLRVGFSTFFLNRTNRSGILRGGIIGGKQQSGKWGIDARFNKVDLIARIRKIARYSSRISVYNEDASNFIKLHLGNIPKRSLVYLDPPYFLRGKKLYENHYTHDDHATIANLISNFIKRPWIVSYDNNPEIVKLYCTFRNLEYALSYSAQDRYNGSEIMFFSNDLIIPVVSNPTRIKLGKLLPSSGYKTSASKLKKAVK